MYWVYILYSERIDKYYIGATSNLQNRVNFHNSDFNKIWTSRGKPWELVFSHKFETHKDAFAAERFIKKQKSRVFILKLINEGWKEQTP